MTRRPPTRAEDVARYLVLLACCEEEPDALTPLRLQKLLYYVQGWHLALAGGPMFKERFEAWANGPVVPAVWKVFSGNSAVAEGEASEAGLTTDDMQFVRSVWDSYKRFGAWSLREMTHSEPPWLNARRGCADGEPSKTPISETDMLKHFESLAKRE